MTSGDLLGPPKPKEMAAGGLADRRRWRPNTSEAAAAGAGEAAAPGGRLPGGGGGPWRQQRWAEPMAVAQAAAECAGVEGEGGRSGGVAGFYWALPRHQRWRVTAAPRWVALAAPWQ